MKQGALIFDEQTDRYDIRFDLADYYGGLHCGECFDVIDIVNIMSEWYLRDASRKVKASHKARGMSGKRLTFKAIYGYMPDPQDKEKWITDPEAAEIVKRIFDLTLEGKGPTQIARILHDEKVERASYHLYQKGIVNYADTYDHSNPYAWSASTIAHIIERPEYMGHTVNFRSYKDSYKDKQSKVNPKENWAIFENTHPPHC